MGITLSGATLDRGRPAGALLAAPVPDAPDAQPPPRDWVEDETDGGKGRETHLARRAYQLYRDLPYSSVPQDRSYRAVADRLGRPETRIKRWAMTFGWDDRCTEHDAQMDAIRLKARREALHQEQKQITAALVQTGLGCLGVAAAVMAHYVDPATGQLRPGRQVDLKDVAPIIKVAVDALAAASDQGSEALDRMSSEEWTRALADSDPDTKAQLIKGLRAARAVRKAAGS